MRIFGYVFGAVAFLAAYASVTGKLPAGVGIPVAVVAGLLARWLVSRGKVSEAVINARDLFDSGTKSRAKGPRVASIPDRAVVYLRSFTSESLTAREIVEAYPVGSLRLGGEEEHLAAALRPVGPLVAIGRPGEEDPTLGASRLYVPDDAWKSQIVGFLENAALVVIRIALTEGLLWEIREAIARVDLKRVLLLVPKDEQEYASFRSQTSGAFPHDLPEIPPGRLVEPGTLAGLIHFLDGGQPEFVRFAEPPILRTSMRRLVPIYRYALKPVFAKLDIPWRPPSYNPFMLWLIFVGVVIMTLFAFIVVQSGNA